MQIVFIMRCSYYYLQNHCQLSLLSWLDHLPLRGAGYRECKVGYEYLCLEHVGVYRPLVSV